MRFDRLWGKGRTTKEHSGAMVALMLDVSDTAALTSAIPAGLQTETDLHITLAYLGQAADLTRQQCADIDGILSAIGTVFGPITGMVQGIGFFNQDAAGQRVLYASFDSPQLPDLRQTVVGALTAAGAPVDDTHGFTPHITLAYAPNGDQPVMPDVPALKITFPAITRMFGGERGDTLLHGDLADANPLTVTKQADGAYRWVLISSNAFQDRDGEVISQKALEADVERADRTGEYGPLLYWHMDGAPDDQGRPTPRVQLGDCDFNAMHNRMLIESGTFKSAQIGEHFQALMPTQGVSIGFRHPISEPGPDGVFQTALRYERSILPIKYASNLLTAVVPAHKETNMLKEKVTALRQVLGGDEALVNSVIELADTKEKAALLAGMRTKAKADPKAGAADEPPGDDAAADKPFSKDEATDSEDPKKAKKETAYLGDLDPDAFLLKVKEIVDAGNATLRTEFTAALGTQSTTKAAADAALVETLKGYESKIDGVAEKVKAALDGVAELKGELPRALGESNKGWRASRDGPEPDETQKQAEPSPDPFAKHWAGIQAAAGRPTAA